MQFNYCDSKPTNSVHEQKLDSKKRPGLEKEQTNIHVSIHIRRIGPVDERKEVVYLNCYFRQYWKDRRLVYNTPKVKELSLNYNMKDFIWRPDTYFINGRESFLHKVSVPNRFFRIKRSGEVCYSQRLTLCFECR
ncbi:gamma-aminobutyric acid receptor subunit alpha-5 [Eurytemora carolleeae]|uniref:gamma-aminobutyric acid receptor subunit alpha-5 n=1 Tax=Eurytemora carolleeae TaxID=1294199 RepID=UPI000C7782AD|nr:gamma-aminobutyric acid receptor subunit alpha-5 [Eurytemora carolleeae]|eukprot:XP_023320173.1 gamma-aminobutyric acid receptor subunit alpha-5-like [Eurytemora affinis]